MNDPLIPVLVVNVQNCARCGADHDKLSFSKFERAPDGFSHFSFCPDTREPILMRVVNV